MQKRKNRKQNMLTVLLFGMLVIFFAAVCYINVSLTPSFYCTDMYSDIMLAKEIWDQKALFPEGWVYGNQLYVVATPVLAALVYGVVGNPFFAMGLASSVMSVLFAFSFCWMLKPVLKREARLFALVFLMAIVAFFGDAYQKTTGWQMFFTMCTYYACYGITAFFAFGCYIRSRFKWNSKLAIMLILVCVLSFATGLQSLRQTAIMGLPLLFVEGIHIGLNLWNRTDFQKGILFSTSLLVAGAIFISNVCGIIAKSWLQVSQVEIFGKTAIISLSQVWGNLQESTTNLFSLFIRAQEYPLWFGAIVVLLYGLLLLYLLFRAWSTKDTAEVDLILLLFSSVAAIFAIDVLLTMAVRPLYYFMLFPLMAFVTARLFTIQWTKILSMVLLLSLFFGACYNSIYPAYEKISQKQDELYYTVSSDIVEMGYDTVYTRWNRGEKLAIASGGKIQAGFWEPLFVGVDYICNPDIFNRNPQQVVYYFDTVSSAEEGVALAKTYQIELELIKYYPDTGVSLYCAPINLLQLCTPERIFES